MLPRHRPIQNVTNNNATHLRQNFNTKTTGLDSFPSFTTGISSEPVQAEKINTVFPDNSIVWHGNC